MVAGEEFRGDDSGGEQLAGSDIEAGCTQAPDVVIRWPCSSVRQKQERSALLAQSCEELPRTGQGARVIPLFGVGENQGPIDIEDERSSVEDDRSPLVVSIRSQTSLLRHPVSSSFRVMQWYSAVE